MSYVAKAYLHRPIQRNDVNQIIRCIESFGSGPPQVEHFRGETILYFRDWGDLELAKREFAELIDAEADLTE